MYREPANTASTSAVVIVPPSSTVAAPASATRVSTPGTSRNHRVTSRTQWRQFIESTTSLSWPISLTFVEGYKLTS